jgi:hypothetical protein
MNASGERDQIGEFSLGEYVVDSMHEFIACPRRKFAKSSPTTSYVCRMKSYSHTDAWKEVFLNTIQFVCKVVYLTISYRIGYNSPTGMSTRIVILSRR